MEREYWKDVVGYEGLYQVSNLGNVKSLNRVVRHSNGNEKIIKDIDKTKTTSKYIGVNWHKGAKKWHAKIRVNGKMVHLGYFKNEHDAFLAYKNKLNNLNK